jgi:phytanoyl-CoA hydroxylase
LTLDAVPASDLTAGALDIGAYQRAGFLVYPDLLDLDEVQSLRRETLRLARGERGQVDGLAEAAPGVADENVLRTILCIHFPHKLSQPMYNLLLHPRLVEVLTVVIGPDVKAMQSMLFVKAEGKPGQAWHQDEYFIPTRDRSLTAAWIALDDATTYHFPYSDDEAVPVEVPAGGAIIFNGYLLHRSLPNKAPRTLRRAVANHYMSAQSLLPWRSPREGEHMAMVDDRDIVMVAGEDPYAYRGFEDRHRAYLRPDHEGGCDR